MDRYAQIVNGVVANIIESPVNPEGVNGNWVLCEGEGVGLDWRYDPETKTFSPPSDPDAPAEPEWAWYIDPGPFTDRLGSAAAFAVDVSTAPPLVAIRSDFARRKWIDLKDPRVRQTVQYLAGTPHPVLDTIAAPLLTPEQATAVLDTPVAPAENLALRKLYFS